MNNDIDDELMLALRKLVIGATVEEIGKDEKGNTKIFKRKLAPNLEAIKFIHNLSQKKIHAKTWQGKDLISGNDKT